MRRAFHHYLDLAETWTACPSGEPGVMHRHRFPDPGRPAGGCVAFRPGRSVRVRADDGRGDIGWFRRVRPSGGRVGSGPHPGLPRSRPRAALTRVGDAQAVDRAGGSRRR